MKYAILAAFLAFSTAAQAGSVNGYYKNNGTYVQPYQRSAPDSTYTNNYNYKGNVNPYTGATGNRSYNGQTGHSNGFKQYTPEPYQD